MAADRYWVGTSGNWSDGANWNTVWDGSGASGVPQFNDNVSISNAIAPKAINYDVPSLYLQYLYLSDNINFSQTASTTSLSLESLQISSATYNLVNGTLTANSETHEGKFVQSGGTNAGGVIILGYHGNGMYTQSGGTTSGELYLGYDQSGYGDYTLSGGQLNARQIVLGRQGTYGTGSGIFKQSGGAINGENVLVGDGGYGSFLQSGGTTTLSGNLRMGTRASDYYSYYFLSGNGTLQANFEYIGESGKARFSQSDSTANTVRTTLALGFNSTGNGTYVLNQGTLNTKYTVVGFYGKGEFAQNGGTHTVAYDLTVGNHTGATGIYSLNSGALQARNEYIGNSGLGTFNQRGGSNTVHNELVIGVSPGGTGVYNLSGGTLWAGKITNNGALAYSGGSLMIGSELINNATLTLSGEGARTINADRLANYGTITATGTKAEIKGQFNNSGLYKSVGSENYFESVFIDPIGYFQAEKGDSFLIETNLINNSMQNTLWYTSGAVLGFTGAGKHEFYLAGADMGAIMAGFTDNFAWQTLKIEGTLVLFDGNTTTGGAQYVDVLLGAILSGNTVSNILGQEGFDIYYLASASGNEYLGGLTYNLTGGGLLIPVGNAVPTPEPTAFWLLGSGLIGLAWLRRRFTN